jgi:predicted ATPase
MSRCGPEAGGLRFLSTRGEESEPSSPPRRRGRVPFVGRQAELAQLNQMLEQARQGRSGLVLVEGPTGIGKTALVRRFLDMTGEPCALVASGEEAETSLAFGLLNQLAARARIPQPDLMPSAQRQERHWADPMAAGAALIDLLGELQQPGLVVVVDDAQWVDRPSLQALTFALRRLRAARVLAVLLTREVADPCLPEGLRRLLTDDRTLQISLGGLGAASWVREGPVTATT